MGEHRTARLKRKPGKRANQQASVAAPSTARRKGKPQFANDNPGTPRGTPTVKQAQSASEASSK